MGKKPLAHTTELLRGIGIVHQELSLADNMPVWHNIFVNREITGPLGFIKRFIMQQRASEILEKLDMRVILGQGVNPAFATKQMIEIQVAFHGCDVP